MYKTPSFGVDLSGNLTSSASQIYIDNNGVNIAGNLAVTDNLTVKGVQVADLNDLALKANVNNPRFTGALDVSGNVNVTGSISIGDKVLTYDNLAALLAMVP